MLVAANAMHEPMLRVLIYRDGDSTAADATLARVAQTLRRAGVRLAGAIQRGTERPDRAHPDMILEDLATGRLVTISEDRGPAASGCRLDVLALEEAAGLARAGLDAGAELLIVNRYGKREAEGHGFRQVIEAAVSRELPVVLVISEEYVPAWEAFASGLDAPAPADAEALADWCLAAIAAPNRTADG